MTKGEQSLLPEVEIRHHPAPVQSAPLGWVVESLLGLLVIVGVMWFLWNRRRQAPDTLASHTLSHTGRTAASMRRSPPSHTGTPAHFAVVDLETSSLSPRDGRIIEVGIVHLDPSGHVTHRWQTLVNSGDGVAGKTSIHGIRADWLLAAPRFEEIAGDIVERLRGRVLAAHNVAFATGVRRCGGACAGGPSRPRHGRGG